MVSGGYSGGTCAYCGADIVVLHGGPQKREKFLKCDICHWVHQILIFTMNEEEIDLEVAASRVRERVEAMVRLGID